MAHDLSIIIPTFNRAQLLERGIATLRETVACDYEIIIVDAGSTDRTADVLEDAKRSLKDRVKIIREEKREGFVRAANKGFRVATGRNMTWINDDARPLPVALDNAVRQIDDAGDEIGFLAMFHRWNSPRNIAFEAMHLGNTYCLCHVRGTLYANFAMGRRETFARLGYFDERYFFYAADPDLSLKAWNAGLRVEPAHGSFIEHDEHGDDRRAADSDRGREDNEKLFAKWNLPPKNPVKNDFDPRRPCTLQGLRSSAA
jgi:GT2 family glycosyltransferase